MFGLKKALVVAAVAGVAAATPAVASAGTWSQTGPAIVEGQLTLTVAANGSTTTCDVRATTNLTNSGGVAGGTVTSFLLGAPAGGTCTTSLPGCTVTATANTSPAWTIATSGTSVTISGIVFANTYSGISCPIDGTTVGASGSITGSASGNQISFSSAGPLTTSFGPATVSGDVFAYAEVDGEPDYDQEITLVP